MSSFYSSRHERSSIDCSVEFFLDLSSQELFDGFIENISESGFCLFTRKHLPVGQEITIRTNIFLRSPSAAVCWIEDSEDGVFKIGMKFV
jgi:hypothetical protein